MQFLSLFAEYNPPHTHTHIYTHTCTGPVDRPLFELEKVFKVDHFKCFTNGEIQRLLLCEPTHIFRLYLWQFVQTRKKSGKSQGIPVKFIIIQTRERSGYLKILNIWLVVHKTNHVCIISEVEIETFK